MKPLYKSRSATQEDPELYDFNLLWLHESSKATRLHRSLSSSGACWPRPTDRATCSGHRTRAWEARRAQGRLGLRGQCRSQRVMTTLPVKGRSRHRLEGNSECCPLSTELTHLWTYGKQHLLVNIEPQFHFRKRYQNTTPGSSAAAGNN